MIRRKNISITFLLLLSLAAVMYLSRPSPAQTAREGGEKAVLSGRVLSVYGPVEKARVRVAGAEGFTLTDSEGRFSFRTNEPRGSKLWVTAAKEGWFNNAQVSEPSGLVPDITLNPIYLGDQSNYRFISPATCYRCHTKLTRYWYQSKMAHTTANPKVLDMYYGTDASKQEGVAPGFRLDNSMSNGDCAACHAPSAAASSKWSQDLKMALRSPVTEWEGISCDYCHKVRKVVPDRTRPSGMGPIMERQSSKTGNSILVFGPYDDVVVPPMAASYNPVMDQGIFCSMCHSHIKKLETGWDYEKIYSTSEWEGFGLKDGSSLPIQTTYQEWKQWQDELPLNDPNKGKKCQDCHMSWRKDMLPYDHYVVDDGARSMWATERSPRTIHPHQFDGGTETQLKTALSMEMEGEVKEGRLNITVYITNTNGGHWVPTGETMRSVMLLLAAFDSKGSPLKMIKGSTLPSWTGEGRPEDGNYAGLPGMVFARVLRDQEGNTHVPFWQATGIASDTRIRPKHTRTLKFEFALADPEDEPTAEAKLIYRPVIRPWAEKKNWPVKDILITSSAW